MGARRDFSCGSGFEVQLAASCVSFQKCQVLGGLLRQQSYASGIAVAVWSF